jgi:hypothetical protein
VSCKKKQSGKQRAYVAALIAQVGEDAAQEAGLRVLHIDIFEPLAPVPSQPWRKEERRDHLTSWEATKLINELQDIAGRKGRRKNNQRRTA